MYGLCVGEEPLRGKLYRYSLRTRTLRARSQVHKETGSLLPIGRSQFPTVLPSLTVYGPLRASTWSRYCSSVQPALPSI